MPVFGTLEDMPLSDVIEFSARRGGLLRLTPPDEIEILIRFEGGRVACAALAERGRIRSPLTRDQLEGRLIAATKKPKTGFRLETEGKLPCALPLDLPVEALLLSLVQTMDEYEAHKEQLPHPHARFQLSGGLGAVEGALRSFAHRAEPLLKRGATPAEIAQALGLPLGQVRYYLYKLEILGAAQVMEAAPVQQTEARERRSLASRLLGFLRRRWAG